MCIQTLRLHVIVHQGVFHSIADFNRSSGLQKWVKSVPEVLFCSCFKRLVTVNMWIILSLSHVRNEFLWTVKRGCFIFYLLILLQAGTLNKGIFVTVPRDRRQLQTNQGYSTPNGALISSDGLLVDVAEEGKTCSVASKSKIHALIPTGEMGWKQQVWAGYVFLFLNSAIGKIG